MMGAPRILQSLARDRVFLRLVPFGASGDWDSRYNDIAVYVAGGWEFFQPKTGWRIYNEALAASIPAR